MRYPPRVRSAGVQRGFCPAHARFVPFSRGSRTMNAPVAPKIPQNPMTSHLELELAWLKALIQVRIREMQAIGLLPGAEDLRPGTVIYAQEVEARLARPHVPRNPGQKSSGSHRGRKTRLLCSTPKVRRKHASGLPETAVPTRRRPVPPVSPRRRPRLQPLFSKTLCVHPKSL